MKEIDQLKRTVNESSELSKKGEHLKALRLLDAAIAQAVQENRSLWVRVLSRHASALADDMGDLQLVRRYREQCLAEDPKNPMALSSLANVLQKQGEKKLARQYAVEAYRLSSQRATELDRALIQSLLQKWPDLQK